MVSNELVNLRLALYEDVWAQPMTAVAKKYGLSDNGIRKRCRSLNIPMPPFGYWPKIKAGKPTIERPPLPPYCQTVLESVGEPVAHDIDVPVKKKSGFLEYQDCNSFLADQLSGMHDLDLLTPESKQTFLDWCSSIAVPGRIGEYDDLISRHKGEIEYREIRDREYPFRDGFINIRYPEGKVKIRNNESVLPITVSNKQRNRAYRIVDTLFRSLRILKAKISVDAHSSGEDNVGILLLDSLTSFIVTENKTKRRHMNFRIDPNDLRPMYDEVYDGRLQLIWTIKESWSYLGNDDKAPHILSYIDINDMPLENRAATMIFEVFKVCCNNKIQAELEQKRYELQREQENRDFITKEQAKAHKEKEQKRLSQQASLINNIPKHANDWLAYKQLTAYLNDLELYASSNSDNAEQNRLLKQYIVLVKANADKCNPINSIFEEMRVIDAQDDPS